VRRRAAAAQPHGPPADDREVSADDNVRLTEGTSAYLDFSEGRERVAGEVLAFLGSVVLFRPDAEVPTWMSDRFADGMEAYLLVSRRGRLHALSGRIIRVGDVLGVTLTDSFRLGQRREWSRADLQLAARLTPDGEGSPIDTITLDVSPSGVAVKWPAHSEVAAGYRLELSGDELEAPIVVQAVPRRVHHGSMGLRFTAIDAADRRRLTLLVLDRLRRGTAAVA
jgi:hypothetical protein